jgi:hypothetical protein
MSVDSQLRSFDKVKEWLNLATSKAPLTQGRATLVHFWSIGSEISKNNMSQIAELRDERKREGLRVIAVHTPHSENERNKHVLLSALQALNMTEPCALDNDHTIRDAFFNDGQNEPAY